MANFKRKGPKSTRSGCLLCKPWKLKGQHKNKYRTPKAFNRFMLDHKDKHLFI